MQVDPIDQIIEQWQQERSAVDVSTIALIGRLSHIEQEIRPKLNAVYAQNGLESWEFDVLATLLRFGAPHQLRPSELLDLIKITSGALTHRIDRLVKRGLVTRTKNPDDGRQVQITLTDTGRAKVDAALIEQMACEKQLLGKLNETQQTQLSYLLRVLHQSLIEDD